MQSGVSPKPAVTPAVTPAGTGVMGGCAVTLRAGMGVVDVVRVFVCAVDVVYGQYSHHDRICRLGTGSACFFESAPVLAPAGAAANPAPTAMSTKVLSTFYLISDKILGHNCTQNNVIFGVSVGCFLILFMADIDADLDTTATFSQKPSAPHPAEGPDATHTRGLAD
eukprot:7291980-Prymnesium_polylepis.1